MSTYVLTRLALAVPTLAGVSLLVFLSVFLMPGDPVLVMLDATGTPATPATVASIRRQLGLDDPLPVQYLRFVGRALQGDLGASWRTHEQVRAMIATHFPSTLQLAVAGLGLALLLGTPLGTIAAVAHRSWLDTATMLFAIIGVSMPSFWLGLLFIYLFSVALGWVSITGYDDLEHLILPAAVLGLQASAVVARLVRSSLLEVLRSEYIMTARAKGLRQSVVALAHALPNALIPAVTVIGLQFGALLGGSVIIEFVFARQGIGQIAVAAIQGKDYPVIQGVVLLVACAYVLVNLAVDLLYAALDPRIRYA